MDLKLPCKPEKPLDSDCCGQGCDPCVLDIYQEELEIWERECSRIRNGDLPSSHTENSEEPEADAPTLNSTEYKSFQITDVFIETHNCKRYRFRLSKGSTLGLKTGQHIVIRATIDGEVVTRQYTPVSDTQQKSYFDLFIKVYKDGKMSKFVKDWEVGTQVQMRGPCGNFLYKPNKYRRVYIFAVGTGLAPMAQVIQSVLGNEDDETLLQLHYGCQTYSDIPLKSWIDDWMGYWNFSCSYYLSQDDSTQTPSYRYGDTIHTSRITHDIVTTVIDGNLDNSLVLICGTRSFEKDVIGWLGDLGVTAEHYHKF